MKWYSYIICAIIIFIGGLCAINLYKTISDTNKINGEIGYVNQYEQECIDYKIGSISLKANYNEDGSFKDATWSQTLLPIAGWTTDKNAKDYLIKINGNEIKDISHGNIKLNANASIAFLEEEDLITLPVNYSIEIKQDGVGGENVKTIVTISTQYKDDMNRLNVLFSDVGFHLEVYELSGGN